MADMGYGYGSEWHLLRYLGRHRAELNARVLDVVGGESINWLDFDFDPAMPFGDREIRGLNFLASDDEARVAWSGIWPKTGNPPNWDAVGLIGRQGPLEWVLVEAKANVEEIESSCGAKGSGLAKIDAALSDTKRRLGVGQGFDWLSGYYQYANRLAVLNALTNAGRSAHLLFIYFTGDKNGGLTCPVDEAEWDSALARQDQHLGLALDHPLSSRVHKLFLPVKPGAPTGHSNTVGELLGKYRGIVDSGVADLATNPRHMDGFGLDRSSVPKEKP